MPHRLVRLLAAVLLAAPLTLGLAARAEDTAHAGPIRVTDAFARAAPAGGVGGLFLTIVNTGPADRLTGVASAASGKAELHESIDDNGVMKMRPVAGIDIPAGGTVKLAPGGYHIMLMGLKQALTAGASLPVTLRFEKAGTVEVAASVVRPGAGAPAARGMDHGMANMPGTAPAK